MKNFLIAVCILGAIGGVTWFLTRPNEPKSGFISTLKTPTITKATVGNALAGGWSFDNTRRSSTASSTLAEGRARTSITFQMPYNDGSVYWVAPVATTSLALTKGYRLATGTLAVTIETDPAYAGLWSGYNESITGTLVVIEY